MMIKHLTLLMSLAFLAGCSAENNNKGLSDPNRKHKDRYKHGTLFGGRGGFSLLGNKDDKPAVGVNAYLWRASLDVLSFMPLDSADPHGGLIKTEWYDTEGKGESRYKISVFILQPKLSSDALRVSVFKQIKTNGVWRDAKPGAEMALEFEDAIFEKARSLRQTKKSK